MMTTISEMKLIQYRDAGLPTYTYFWTKDNKVFGPYFNSEKEAHDWINSAWDNWKANRDLG
jgi:hypothetical protein